MMQAITKKPVDLSVLESMVKELELSETQRADLLASLRKFNLSDDNDPVLKITLATGIMARYMSDMPDEMAKRFESISQSVQRYVKEIDAMPGRLEFYYREFIERLQRRMDGGLKSLSDMHGKSLDVHQDTLDRQQASRLMLEDMAKEVKRALDHAQRLNDYNSWESSFRVWIGVGAVAALIFSIVACCFSVSNAKRIERIAKQSECNLSRIYDLHREKFPAYYANDDK